VKEPVLFAATLILLATLIYSQPALSDKGQEKGKIEGAFGIKLGQTWDRLSNPLKYLLHGKAKSKNMAFLITPKIKNDNFMQYYVYLTPTSGKVYQILATDGRGRFDDSRQRNRLRAPKRKKEVDCKTKRRAIFDLLKKKYDGDVLPYSINQGSRSVKLNCTNEDLFISYYDSDLIDLAEKEAKEKPKTKEFKAEDIDPSGL